MRSRAACRAPRGAARTGGPAAGSRRRSSGSRRLPPPRPPYLPMRTGPAGGEPRQGRPAAHPMPPPIRLSLPSWQPSPRRSERHVWAAHRPRRRGNPTPPPRPISRRYLRDPLVAHDPVVSDIPNPSDGEETTQHGVHRIAIKTCFASDPLLRRPNRLRHIRQGRSNRFFRHHVGRLPASDANDVTATRHASAPSTAVSVVLA